jgi:hypothetical protein
MSRTKLREDKKCQNCGHFVAERFCPFCGQENVETRQPFYHLFAHFFGDFIHYDNHFWRTIKDLYRPAKLTQAYLSGKRKSYVAPVQLYIFISFLVFFIPFVLPDMNETQDKTENQPRKASNETIGEKIFQAVKNDQVNNTARTDTIAGNKEDKYKYNIKTNSPEITEKLLTKVKSMKYEKVEENLIHNIPKAIFLYMPIFAFWLWIFHSKKKRLYFDHGIYTLHYFSFVLLTILLYIIINWLLSIFQRSISSWITLAMLCYFIYYFFHSHRKLYQESKILSRTKCIFLFFINTICMLVFIVLYFILIVLFFS